MGKVPPFLNFLFHFVLFRLVEFEFFIHLQGMAKCESILLRARCVLSDFHSLIPLISICILFFL